MSEPVRIPARSSQRITLRKRPVRAVLVAGFIVLAILNALLFFTRVLPSTPSVQLPRQPRQSAPQSEQDSYYRALDEANLSNYRRRDQILTMVGIEAVLVIAFGGTGLMIHFMSANDKVTR